MTKSFPQQGSLNPKDVTTRKGLQSLQSSRLRGQGRRALGGVPSASLTASHNSGNAKDTRYTDTLNTGSYPHCIFQAEQTMTINTLDAPKRHSVREKSCSNVFFTTGRGIPIP